MIKLVSSAFENMQQRTFSGQKKYISRLIYHVNYMLANESHGISSLILFCQESEKFKSAIHCKFEVVLQEFKDLEVHFVST